MKKRYFIGSTLVIALCAIVLCAFADQERTDASEAVVSERPIPTTVSRTGGKVLVAYFSVPETDGVDASSGASRLVSDGKLQGNTEYVATVIREATGGDLFEIKTVHTYPGTHKELIDAAKKESDEDARPALATHIKNLNEYDVVFVGFPNWWYDMPQPLYTFFTSMISVARPSFRSARMAAAVSRMLSRLSARWRKGRPSLMAMPLPATV